MCICECERPCSMLENNPNKRNFNGKITENRVKRLHIIWCIQIYTTNNQSFSSNIRNKKSAAKQKVNAQLSMRTKRKKTKKQNDLPSFQLAMFFYDICIEHSEAFIVKGVKETESEREKQKKTGHHWTKFPTFWTFFELVIIYTSSITHYSIIDTYTESKGRLFSTPTQTNNEHEITKKTKQTHTRTQIETCTSKIWSGEEKNTHTHPLKRKVCKE